MTKVKSEMKTLTFERFAKVCGSLVIGVMVSAQSLPPSSARESKAQQPAVNAEAERVRIPFAPPLNKKLRYRWEKSVTRDGKTTPYWSVNDWFFKRAGKAFTLTVEPVMSGPVDTTPNAPLTPDALENQFGPSMSVRVSADGEIAGLIDEDRYWRTYFQAMDEMLAARLKGLSVSEDGRVVADAMIKLMKESPREARLARLTESLQPYFEFVGTELGIRAPIVAAIDTDTPLGVVKANVSISLEKVENDVAHMSMRQTIPHDEMTKLLTAFAARMESKTNALAAAMTDTKRVDKLVRDIETEYEISLKDGSLIAFRSNETVEVSFDGEATRRQTMRALTRID